MNFLVTEDAKLQVLLLAMAHVIQTTHRRSLVDPLLYVNLDADMPNWDLGLENCILSGSPLSYSLSLACSDACLEDMPSCTVETLPPGAEDRKKLRQGTVLVKSAGRTRIGSAGPGMPCRQPRAVDLAAQVARIRVPNLVMGHVHHTPLRDRPFATKAELLLLALQSFERGSGAYSRSCNSALM